MAKRKQDRSAGKDVESEAAKLLESMVAVDPSDAVRKWLEICQAFSPVSSVNLVDLFEGQQRNRDVWMSAMKRAGEMAEGIVARQRESFNNNMNEAFTAMSAMSDATAPAERLAAQADYIRRTLTKAMEDTEELCKFLTQEQKQILELLLDRMDDFIEEIEE